MARTEPRFDILPPISNGSADLQIFRAGAKQPPTTHAGDAQLDELCDLMFIQQFGRIGQKRLHGCRGDRTGFVGGGFGNWLFGCLAMLILQFDNTHVEPFDFLEGDQVYFTKQFDDLGLGWVHARIMAFAVAGVARGRPGRCGRSWRLQMRLYGQFWSGWSGPVAPIPTLEGYSLSSPDLTQRNRIYADQRDWR